MEEILKVFGVIYIRMIQKKCKHAENLQNDWLCGGGGGIQSSRLLATSADCITLILDYS